MDIDCRKKYNRGDTLWKVTKRGSSPESSIQQVKVTQVDRNLACFSDELAINSRGEVVKARNVSFVQEGVFYVSEFAACEALVQHCANFHKLEESMRTVNVQNVSPDTVAQILKLLDEDTLFKNRKIPKYCASEDDE